MIGSLVCFFGSSERPALKVDAEDLDDRVLRPVDFGLTFVLGSFETVFLTDAIFRGAVVSVAIDLVFLVAISVSPEDVKNMPIHEIS